MTLRVLVACEFSGTIRDAFAWHGHDVWSCDVLPDEHGSQWHIQGDVRNLLEEGWDLLIACPPCTRLCKSGLRWHYTPPPGRTIEEIETEFEESVALFLALRDCPIPHIAIENPVPHWMARARIGDPTQAVQPWQFGEPETKATCLWLKGLPDLMQTEVVMPHRRRIHYASQGPGRWRERSRFYPGIAMAMADQWGPYLERIISDG